MPLIKSFLEFTTKFECADRPITEEEIIEKEWMTETEIEHLRSVTRRVGDIMNSYLIQKEVILADFKLEYGKRREDGEIILADGVGTTQQ